MIWFKACPRCDTGAIVMDSDVYGQHIQCLQCGYMRDVEDKRDAVTFLVNARHAKAGRPVARVAAQ